MIGAMLTITLITLIALGVPAAVTVYLVRMDRPNARPPASHHDTEFTPQHRWR